MADEKKTEVKPADDGKTISIVRIAPDGTSRVRECKEADFEYFRVKGFKKA